jgi:hypothetical protein
MCSKPGHEAAGDKWWVSSGRSPIIHPCHTAMAGQIQPVQDALRSWETQMHCVRILQAQPETERRWEDLIHTSFLLNASCHRLHFIFAWTLNIFFHDLPMVYSFLFSLTLLQEIKIWDRSIWGRLAGSSVYCAGTDPADWCPKAEPWEQRGRTLYTLVSRFQEQKAKLNPHMAACDFIGYFISLVLCDLHVLIL